MISLITENCTGCMQCEKACLFGGIKIDNKKPIITELCTGCGICVDVCSSDAIVLKGKKGAGKHDVECTAAYGS